MSLLGRVNEAVKIDKQFVASAVVQYLTRQRREPRIRNRFRLCNVTADVDYIQDDGSPTPTNKKLDSTEKKK